jgi:hypothetical protein
LVIDTAEHLASVDLSAFDSQIMGIYNSTTHALSHINAVTIADLADPSFRTNNMYAAAQASLAPSLNAAGVHSLSDLTQVQIADSISNILSNLDALQAVSGQIASVSVISNSSATTGIGAGSNSASINASSLLADSSIIGKIGAIPAGSINVNNASVADALTLNASMANALSSIQINDSASHISTHLDDLAALGSKLGSISLSSYGGDNTLLMTPEQFARDALVLSKFSVGFSVNIYGASAAEAAVLENLGGNVRINQLW